MRKRLLLGAGALACLALLALLGLWWLTPRSAINRTNFEAIRGGMSEAEVERLLGGPEGDYRTGEVEYDLAGGLWELDNVMSAPEVIRGEIRVRLATWQGDEGIVSLFFDDEGRVLATMFRDGRRTSFDPLALLRRWLKF